MLSAEQLNRIGELVAKHDALSDHERRRYQETEVRTNFIDLLFAALGWEVHNRSHVERETTVEEGKRPDYAFKISGVPRLFLEAKSFRQDIYDEAETRKAITKAYNKGVPWIGVTNFTRFVLYDAQEELSKSSPRRVIDLTYEDYPKADLEVGLHLLTPESLQDRTLEEYAQRSGARRRVVPIEKRLYESMREWREKLFNALYLVKQWKTEGEFRTGDEAIQRLLDRLVFLRNCEDRGIGGTDLRALRNRIRSDRVHARVTESLLRVFAGAAKTYDSELFQTDAIIDVLMQGMGTILDAPLREIIEQLYAVPRSYSDYDFSQMEPDVLGEVYEQYLGYVPQRVRKLATQPALPGMPIEQITLEAKRQRRKEHGIYYTPRWVVQYIVQETLGHFLEEYKSRPDTIDNVTILDPACGSGSFLIRAYETLLQYHAERMGGDVGHLDTRTRERILRRNIYGVDIDRQAVEIARLNLLIRMVRQQELLPELKGNIQHGNSLIEGDESKLRPFFGSHWRDKFPFDWAQRFPAIMESGGFDMIIGNPPYVGFHGFEDEKPYFRERYATARSRFDLYIPFVERALQLLKPGGLFGFICPTNFMKRAHGQALRALIAQETTVLSIHDFQDLQAFEGALNYTGILVLRKSRPNGDHVFDYSSRDLGSARHALPQSALSSSGTWIFRHSANEAVVRRAQEVPTSRLGDVTASIAEGIVTGKNDVFVLTGDQAARLGVEPGVIRKVVRGRQIKRYTTSWDGTYLIYPYRLAGDRTVALAENEIASLFPRAYEYLTTKRATLGGRGYFDKSSKLWFELWCERDLRQQASLKLLTPELADANKFALCPSDIFYLDTVCGLTLKDGVRESPLFLLGILNSAWANYFYRSTTVPKANGFLIYKTMYLKDFPVRRIDFSDASQRAAHDELVKHVRNVLDLHTRLVERKDIRDYERERIELDIASVDQEIDSLVYDLYALTAGDRATVASEVAPSR